MYKNALATPPELRRMALKALISILLFISIYVLCVFFAVALTVLCGYLGLMIAMAYPSWATGALGLVLAGTGIIVLIFVIKFIFKRTEKVKPLMVEVKAAEEPELFKLIQEITGQLNISLPKKVYLSPEVNAGVFYDSLFLSMFFPVRKNLMLGMGIINTHTIEELKAVIAHEFGHFSQRSMRIGSYVHHSNKVLHNMLYENENFERTVEAWGDSFSYFKVAGALGLWIVRGMQSILKRVHNTLNVNYLALSREMEYHADAVAAIVAGSKPVMVSLLRMDLAEVSLNIVHGYHESKISEGLKPLNIYPQQYFVMSHLARRKRMEFKNGLPEFNPEDAWKFKRSKLVWTDQWATHPAAEDRINRIKDLEVTSGSGVDEMAVGILKNRTQLEQDLTAKIYEHYFEYAKAPQLTDFTQFETDFLNRLKENSYDERFRGYFDDRMPYYKFDLESLNSKVSSDFSFQDLFNEEGLTNILEQDILDADLEVLKNVVQEHGGIISFDYDGTRYGVEDCPALVLRLEERLTFLKGITEQRNLDIFEYFNGLAFRNNCFDEWKEQCKIYKEAVDGTFRCQDAHVALSNAGAFMNVTTPFEEITIKMEVFKEKELEVKSCVLWMLQTAVYRAEIGEEKLRMFENYIAEDWIYFENKKYLEDNLKKLFELLPIFQSIFYEVSLKVKRELLTFYGSLLAYEDVSVSAMG